MTLKEKQQLEAMDKIRSQRVGDVNVTADDLILTIQLLITELEKTRQELKELKKELGG